MIAYKENLCFDSPDTRDYSAQQYIDMAMGTESYERPTKEVIIQDQKKTSACTRYASVVINNGQNINEYNKNWQKYDQIDPLIVWNRGNKNLTLTSALSQLKTEGLIAGRTAIKKVPSDKSQAILTMKQAIDMGNYIFTWSDNGDWGKTWTAPFTYTLRTDGRIVWHAWAIVTYDESKQMFKCPNSRWPKRWDKWYFRLRYEDIDKIFTKYCIIDKDDSWVFAKFARKQKAIELVNACSTFWNGETELQTQTHLHDLAEQLRQEYNLI